MRMGLVVAALLLLVPVAAAAQDAYETDGDSGLPNFAGLRGSMAFTGHAQTNVPTSPSSTALRPSFDVGGGGSVYVGTRLPAGFRVELEGLYRYLPINRVNVADSASDYIASGRAQLGAGMVNLFWDWPVPDFPFRPFFGAGIGGAYADVDAADNLGNDYLRSASWHFAYQVMGGAEMPINQTSRLTAMYRWLQVNDINSKCGIAGAPTYSCKANLNTQSLDLGLEMDL